jgi:hypothetical protein
MEKLDEIKKILINDLSKVSTMLRRGDERSEKIAVIASHLQTLSYTETGPSRNRILRDIERIYTEMQVKYNEEMYKEAGGVAGSGKLVAATSKDSIHKKAMERISGIDLEGFNMIQTRIAFMQDPNIKKIMGMAYMDQQESADDFFAFIYQSFWLLLLCCYSNGSYAERIKKVIMRSPAPSLN